MQIWSSRRSIEIVVLKRRIIVVIRKDSRCLLLHWMEQHRRILLSKQTYRTLAEPADPCGNPFGDVMWKIPISTLSWVFATIRTKRKKEVESKNVWPHPASEQTCPGSHAGPLAVSLVQLHWQFWTNYFGPLDLKAAGNNLNKFGNHRNHQIFNRNSKQFRLFILFNFKIQLPACLQNYRVQGYQSTGVVLKKGIVTAKWANPEIRRADKSSSSVAQFH